MYDHGPFSSEPKLLSEISRRPEHVATSIGYVKKVYGRAKPVGTGACCINTVPNAEGSKSVADVFMIVYFVSKNEIFSKRVF